MDISPWKSVQEYWGGYHPRWGDCGQTSRQLGGPRAFMCRLLCRGGTAMLMASSGTQGLIPGVRLTSHLPSQNGPHASPYLAPPFHRPCVHAPDLSTYLAASCSAIQACRTAHTAVYACVGCGALAVCACCLVVPGVSPFPSGPVARRRLGSIRAGSELGSKANTKLGGTSTHIGAG
jgi:hypothetical protein